MTRQDVKLSLTRIGVWLGAILGFWALLTAFRSVLDDRYVTRWDMARRDSIQAIRNERDSVFQRKVGRWVDYQICRERWGVKSCLDPDRP